MTTDQWAVAAWWTIHRDMQALADAPDPRRQGELLDARANLWLRLGQEVNDEPGDPRSVYAIACQYAAILDQEHAARIRSANGLPTLYPATEAALLQLDERVCRACGRAWQRSEDGACEACPQIRFSSALGWEATP